MTTTTAVSGAIATECPYVGLIPYSEEDKAIFFGRDPERTALISNLRASRLTILYAQSGVGKSSVLRAGVAARLEELARRSPPQRGSARYIPVVFSSWQDEPTDGLAAEVQRAVIPFLRSASPPGPAPRELHEVIQAASRAAGATLLVMLDQFEEYFLYRSMEARDGRFADELAACINRADLRANFLISIREDAYSELGDLFQGRVINVYGNYFHLEHLTRESARQAIEKPIASYNLRHENEALVEIDPDLVNVILDQLEPGRFAPDQGGMGRLADGSGTGHRGGKVAAPYLQLVMRRIWETELARGSKTLHPETLKELGGTKTIVQNYVDRALGNVPDDDREAVADILRHLVTPSGTKIALAPSDLAVYTEQSVAEVNVLLGGLAGILHTVPPPPGQQDGMRFEISHDLLAPAILDWVGRRRAAQLEHAKEIAEQQTQKEKRRARLFGLLAIVSVILLLVTIILAIGARHATQQAVLQRDIAVSMQVAGESEALTQQEPWTASQLAVAAWRIHHTPQAYASMLNVLAQPDHGVLLTGQGHNTLRSVAFSPDGKTLATAGPAGTSGLWDIQDRHLINTHGVFRAGVYSVAFSPDGKTLAIGEAHGQVRLWDITTGRQVGAPLTAGPGQVDSVAFSPDGRLLATAGADGTARLWSVATHRQVYVFPASSHGAVDSVAFSPDGRILATAGADGTARLWSVATHHQVYVFPASSHGAVNSVAFSPDGRILATSGADGTARLWNVATHQQVAGPLLTVNGIPLFGVAFSPDGQTIATAGADGTARLWDTVTYRQIGSSLPGRGATKSVAVSPDGRILATAGADGTARLWSVATHRQVGALQASATGAVNSVAFSPDGRILATAGADGTARLWSAVTMRKMGEPFTSNFSINSVAFSPHSTIMATAGTDSIVRLWNDKILNRLAAGRSIGAPFTFSGQVSSVAFSPDGQLLATAGQDGTARLWDVVTHQQIGASLTAGSGSVTDVAFSPSGGILITTDTDGSTRLWNVFLPRQAASQVCSIAHGSLGLRQWDTYIRGVPFMTVC